MTLQEIFDLLAEKLAEEGILGKGANTLFMDTITAKFRHLNIHRINDGKMEVVVSATKDIFELGVKKEESA